MRTCHSLAVILLALSLRVSAERLVRVIATIPNESLIDRSTDQSLIETRQSSDDGTTRFMKDVEVTGFITKNGDLFEMGESRGMGSIESRQEPEPGMTMCRYGTIVVYSDTDCNNFFIPSQNFGIPEKNENNEEQSDVEETDERPLKKKKKKAKGNRRKLNKNKAQKRRKNIKRKSPVRRKVLKQGGNKNRRRNGSNQKRKRRKNLQNKQQNQRRRNKKNSKRKRINRRD